MVSGLRTLVFSLAIACAARIASAAPPEDSPAPRKAKPAGAEPAEPPANVSGKTLGGMQFWADELVYHDWRIQRHTYTGHCRLLDGSDVRQAWGTFSQCQAALDEAKRTRDMPPLSRKVVIVLHGLVRTRGNMEPLGDYVSRNSDFEVLQVGYPSTRADLATHAAGLASVVKHLEGVEEINFVAHSLGNLVIRRYLGDQVDARIKRIVMLGPPNNGAQFAMAFKDNPLMDLVWGKSATELATGWKEVSKKLAIPAGEFGIIAGNAGINPLVKGEHDYVVSVEETKLPGASDFLVAEVSHSNLVHDRKLQEYTLRFLENGYFVSPEKRQPLKEAATARAKP